MGLKLPRLSRRKVPQRWAYRRTQVNVNTTTLTLADTIVVTEEGTPEEVDESVAGVEVYVIGCDVEDDEVVKMDNVVISTPARVSCTSQSGATPGVDPAARGGQ